MKEDEGQGFFVTDWKLWVFKWKHPKEAWFCYGAELSISVMTPLMRCLKYPKSLKAFENLVSISQIRSSSL